MPPGAEPSEAPRDRLAGRIAEIPDRPGVYLFKDGEGRILYIGKARSLPSRLRSYLGRPDGLSPKIRRMVAEARDLEVILTATEIEALILENNLVKKQQPRYNTLLRDDKNFPYLRLTIGDPWPRVVLVRKARQDGSLYFGPYLPAANARRALRMVAKFFRVAICHERLDGSRPRPCLYYQLDQCLGPCAGLAEAQPYRQAAEEARLFLEGKNQDLLARLRHSMQECSERQEYERAAHYRDLVNTIASFSEKQNIASVGLEQQDYFHVHREGEQAVVQLFCMRNGLVQSRREFSFEGVQEEDDAFLSRVLQLYYSGPEGAAAADATALVPSQIYVPFDPAERGLLESWLAPARILVPKRGVRAGFLETVRKNAKLAFESRFRSPYTYGVEVLEALQEALGIPEPPYRIECFDISHIQGAQTVASMVAWEGGRPRRADYRRFRIKTVAGVDDFASMREVVSRRYARLLKEGKNLPDLVLIDGGRGQLGAALQGLSDAGISGLPIAALAKKEELLFVPDRAEPIVIDHHSPILHLVQRIRDEAHRFAVTYHRALRKRRTLTTALIGIPGVGETTARRLLKTFGSIEALRGVTVEQMEAVVPRKTAVAVARYLESERR